MKLKQTALALAIGLMAASAQAALWRGDFQTSNGSNYHDGVLGIPHPPIPKVVGMDLYSAGSSAFFCDTDGGCGGGAVPKGAQINPGTLGNVALGDYVLTYYQGIVSAINPGVPAPNLLYPGATPDDPEKIYQITLAAGLREQVVYGGYVPGVGVLAVLKVLSGRYGLYYDDNDVPGNYANIGLGTGYTDGIEILEGSIFDGSTDYTVTSIGSAKGSTNIKGQVIYAKIGVDDPHNHNDEVGFMPNAPTGVVASATIQYGIWAPNLEHETVNFFDNANGWTPIPVIKSLTVRADANTDFTVPEPTTLALLGLGLAGLGLSLRRRAA